MFGLIFTRRYSMAHRLLVETESKCAVPHGHNEHVIVRLEATAPGRLDGAYNMVASFAAAKARWHRWIDEAVDHTLHLAETDPLLDFFRNHEPTRLSRLLITPGDPTTEMLALCFMTKLDAFLEHDGLRLRCAEVRIEETPTNTVAFAGNPTDFLPARAEAASRPPWWRRPDMSINDLDRPGTAS